MELSRFTRRSSPGSPLSSAPAAVTPDHHEAESPDGEDALLVCVVVFAPPRVCVEEVGDEGVPFAVPAGVLEADEDDVCVVFSVCVCVVFTCLPCSVHRFRILPCREERIVSCAANTSSQVKLHERTITVTQTDRQTDSIRATTKRKPEIKEHFTTT